MPRKPQFTDAYHAEHAKRMREWRQKKKDRLTMPEASDYKEEKAS